MKGFKEVSCSQSPLLTVLLLGLLQIACTGGELLEVQYQDPELEEVYTGEPVAGEPIAGEPIAGEPIAGEPIAGEPIAGEPIAGEPIAGEPLAGEMLVDCGLDSNTARLNFALGPLDMIATNCTSIGCHNADSFRQFKLSFNQAATDETYSTEQISEALQAIEPFLLLGNGRESILSQRVIDGHSSVLDFNEESPQYINLVEWIDSVLPCP